MHRSAAWISLKHGFVPTLPEAEGETDLTRLGVDTEKWNPYTAQPFADNRMAKAISGLLCVMIRNFCACGDLLAKDDAAR